jgi:glutamyl-tRNA synthetase
MANPVITRFAPSPTGLLHIGNIRTALVNWLLTKKLGGQFILRIDDTDRERSKDEYITAIQEDLTWLGLTWERLEHQSHRLARYRAIVEQLIAAGRLYPCYETKEELEVKRKMQLGRGLPPVYDRAALKLTEADHSRFAAQGIRPHYRFLIEYTPIIWEDMVRQIAQFDGQHISDPIVVREDGTLPYMLCSVIDDIDFGITHIVRGEDHVSNTAVQMQMFHALGATPPTCGHLALMTGADTKISKREGGFEIRQLRDDGIEALAILSVLARLGTSDPITPCTHHQALINGFDISHFGRAPTTYDPLELEAMNHKIIAHYRFADIAPRLAGLGLPDLDIDEAFWLSVRSNLKRLDDLKIWWQVCRAPLAPTITDPELLTLAAELLPQELGQESWQQWTQALKEKSGKNGKQLFMPLRLALTAMEHGPELKDMLPLIGYERARRRLLGEVA